MSNNNYILAMAIAYSLYNRQFVNNYTLETVLKYSVDYMDK